MPRVERNMSQLMEACDQLYNKTARDVKTQEVNAAILLGSVGVDLPSMQQHLRDLTAKLKSGAAAAPTSASSLDYQEPLRDTDIAGFLKRERENALLSVIEETKRLTFEQVSEHLKIGFWLLVLLHS